MFKHYWLYWYVNIGSLKSACLFLVILSQLRKILLLVELEYLFQNGNVKFTNLNEIEILHKQVKIALKCTEFIQVKLFNKQLFLCFN